MAAKLTLKPNPTFKHTVSIPVPGGDAEPVEFVFKGKTKSEFKALMDAMAEEDKRDDAEKLMDFVAGWNVPADFTKENVAQFLETYIGSGALLLRKYTEELTKAVLGN